DAQVVFTPVPAFDTLSAGFCVAQLALTDGPSDRVVYCNVAPRQDRNDPRPDNQGERLIAGRTAAGVLVVAPNSRYTFSIRSNRTGASGPVENHDKPGTPSPAAGLLGEQMRTARVGQSLYATVPWP
ncbi:MAG: hypothetical protein M3300_12885, partial [Actinomycetota bacterium]|nr:hypothetical protein [Actinomycetota bacterium]